MANNFFRFKEFTVQQARSAMKVTTDSCAFGAWVAEDIHTTTGNHKEFSQPLLSTGCDIGTGTGLLSLMIAQKNQISIDALEIDAEAAVEASENFKASPWFDRLHILETDVRLFQTTKKYDFIISNPPFHEKQLSSPLKSKKVAHHSGELCLIELLSKMKRLLSSTGYAYLLMPAYRESECIAAAREFDFHIQHLLSLSPTKGHPPNRVFLRFANSVPGTIIKTELIIKEHGSYTTQFLELLGDYYL